MGPILGYTGRASSEELTELRKKNPEYTNDAIVGKVGIEKYMETTLQGTDGEETVTVDNLGKVLKIDDSTRVEPVAGNDVYLTVDSKLAVSYLSDPKAKGCWYSSFQDRSHKNL